MDLRVVGRALGLLLCALALALLPPWMVSLSRGEPAARAFLLTAAVAAAVGAALAGGLRRHRLLRLHEALFTTAVGAAVACLVGAFPLLLSGTLPRVTDACFESVAGWTTTAASVLSDPAQAPAGVLLWRALMQWLGGLTFLVLATTVLPLVGAGVLPLGGKREGGRGSDRLTPRIIETAKLLWGVYLLLTLVQVLALVACGAEVFDAVCHALSTVSTGGFSTHADSVGAFHSRAVEGVMVVFMLAAGVNFTLHSLVVVGRWRSVRRDGELHVYLALAGLTTAVLIAAELLGSDASAAHAARVALFRAASTVSTCGFVLGEPAAPVPVASALLLLVMLVGGCAGSTAGGLKVLRALLLARHAGNELRRPLHPQAVYALRHDGAAVPAGVLSSALVLLLLLLAALAAGTLGLTLVGLDLGTAVQASGAALSNTGALGGGWRTGAGYATVPLVGKWILIFCMLLGRLELITLLVMFTPDFWRRS